MEKIDQTIESALDGLRRQWGIDLRRAHAVVGLLVSTRPVPMADLVLKTGLSHRSIKEIVQTLGPFVEELPAGFVMDREHHRAVSEVLAAARPSPLTAVDKSAMLSKLGKVLADRPSPIWQLDHVPATTETLWRRAAYMHSTFNLRDAAVLIVGDQDMTSIALALISPSTDIVVVDIDERLLSFIHSARHALGLRIRPVFSDLRIAFPRSLLQHCHLAFADPPYTEEGLRLFLQRAVQSLVKGEPTRILLAYGFGDRQLANAYKAQSVIHSLRLVQHAMLPDFHHYEGAQAIGSRSDLYVLEPTSRSFAASREVKEASAIYSKGREGRNVSIRSLPSELLDALPEPIDWLLVGNPLPGIELKQRVSIDAFFRTRFLNNRAQRIVVNAYPSFGSSLLRLCLHANADDITLIGSWRAVTKLRRQPYRELVLLKYREAWYRQAGNAGVLALAPRETSDMDATDSVMTRLLRKPAARLGSAWRESLIRHFRRRDVAITKNEARGVIADTEIGLIHGESFVVELPEVMLLQLRDAIARTIALLEVVHFGPQAERHQPLA
ncbi:MAG: bis-aminopropyl spermidine synthase family protein [Gammaproteobacteria bacterium]|nr:bis-aminopropyl spermidine synthase family protein [Gammaproteobacteria bacterium]